MRRSSIDLSWLVAGQPVEKGRLREALEALTERTERGDFRALGAISVLDFGAVGDGEHDDADALQGAVEHARRELSPSLILFPPTERSYFISREINIRGLSDVTFLGYGARIRTQESHFAFNTAPNWSDFHRILRAYVIGGRYRRGDRHVVIRDSAIVDQFSSGDAIYFAAENLMPGGRPEVPYAELNVVSSVDKGGITLQYPFAKPFPLTERGVLRLFNASKITSHNLQFLGLTFDTRQRRALNLLHVHQVRILWCNFRGAGAFVARGRRICVKDIFVSLEGTQDTRIRPYYAGFDIGTSDASVDGMFASSQGSGQIHLHEGLADVTIGNCTLHQGQLDNDGDDEQASRERNRIDVISIKAITYNVTISNCRIINCPSGDGLNSQSSNVWSDAGNSNLHISGCQISGAVHGRGLVHDDHQPGALIAAVRVDAECGKEQLRVMARGSVLLCCTYDARRATIGDDVQRIGLMNQTT